MTAQRPLGRVLSARDAGLYADATATLAAAAAAAREHRETAARDAEAARQRVLEAAAWEAQLQAGVVLAETARTAHERLRAIQPELGQAIAEGVARIIGGLDLADRVALAAAHAVESLSLRHAATIRVRPSAVTATEARLAGWGGSLRVVADDALPDDGCVIESEAGFVRAHLSEQLAALQGALAQAANG